MASRGDASCSPPSCEDSTEKKNSSVSFGFAKTLSKFKVTPGDAVTNKDDVDYLTGIARNQLQSTKPSEGPTERVIPVILKNRWRVPEREEPNLGNGEQVNGVDHQDSVEAQAVKELIEESRKKLEDSQANADLTIPLLAQNKVPDGFEDGERLNVELRPEPSTEDDYERVPVEGYGLAMLKGMGWKKGEGIGRTFKQDVKPYEYKPRVIGLGLGADRSAIADLEPGKRRRPPKPGEERREEEEEQSLVLARGGCVLLESGAHKERYGKIEALDADNARVLVKLAIGGDVVSVHQYAVKLVGRKEYDRYAKDLSRLSKAHKNKAKEEKKHEQRRQQDHREDDKKRKHTETHHRREKTPEKEGKRAKAPPCWLQRDLKVRFVDQTYKGGRYYNAKMRVEDVVTPSTCICRTEEGRLIDDVKQDMLETIVPKSEGDAIMVVLGEHRGQVGRILRRDKNACQATVQLDRHEKKLFTLDYDFICHYLGAADHF
ncbi:G-patch domain and KOW motifs-containing protein [Corythoichthys intestinalis]|uniref:G-patch domain and KOW motifs-containing protein n=1 Tax=Corythoichthys intestinalis TaxID=161448 RepID=UPI0025A5C3F6|nr:G-patch domain and KOW motifs-containing protein [Corythoichthys intestinalis]XP_061802995.1 G-patch domain and KOW motifs-containing protein-like [Nerophis lumbriciformis]